MFNNYLCKLLNLSLLLSVGFLGNLFANAAGNSGDPAHRVNQGIAPDGANVGIPVTDTLTLEEHIKKLSETVQNGNDNQKIAIPIEKGAPATATAVRSGTQTGILFAKPIASGCDPTVQTCALVYENTNVGEIKKIVNEAKRIDPKILKQVAIQNPQTILNGESANSLQSVESVNSKQALLLTDKKFSNSLAVTLSYLRKAEAMQANEGIDPQSESANLDKNRAHFAESDSSLLSDSAKANADLQNQYLGTYVNSARESVGLEAGSLNSTGDLDWIKSSPSTYLANAIRNSASAMKKFDASDVAAIKYVPYLADLSKLPEFQSLIQKALGDTAQNNFNAATVAADLSSQKGIGKARLGVISDLYAKSTGTPGPADEKNAADEGSKGTGTAGYASSMSSLKLYIPNTKGGVKSSQVATLAGQVSDEYEIDWVNVAKEISSTQALSNLKRRNPALAKTLLEGRAELDRFIAELRNVFGLGFLKIIDPRVPHFVAYDLKEAKERIALILQKISSLKIKDDESKKDKLQILKADSQMLQNALKEIHKVDLVSAKLHSYFSTAGKKDLWRENFLDEYRLLRSEIGFLSALKRIAMLKQKSAFSTLVNIAFNEMNERTNQKNKNKELDQLKNVPGKPLPNSEQEEF